MYNTYVSVQQQLCLQRIKSFKKILPYFETSSALVGEIYFLKESIKCSLHKEK